MLDGHAALNFSHHVCGWHGSQGSVPFGCPLGGVSASKTLTRTPASLILFDGRPVAHQCWTRLDTKFMSGGGGGGGGGDGGGIEGHGAASPVQVKTRPSAQPKRTK